HGRISPGPTSRSWLPGRVLRSRFSVPFLQHRGDRIMEGMARVTLFHWKAAEAGPLIAALRAAGHKVEHIDQMGKLREVREKPAEAIVLDLSRLPSHGRQLGIFLRGWTHTWTIPIVYVNGDAEKVAAIQRVLPEATYTASARIKSAVKSALAHPPTHRNK